MRKVTFLVAESGNVDFDGPVELNAEERARFLALLKRTFDSRVVEEETESEIRTDRIGDRAFVRPWTATEYAILLEPVGTEEMSRRLGRSWMSVVMKRGEFYGPFLEWANAKGRNLLKGDVEELIKEYLAEKRLLTKTATRERNEKRRRIEQLESETRSLKEEQSKFGIFPWNTDRYLERRKWIVERLQKIPEEISDLRRQLEKE